MRPEARTVEKAFLGTGLSLVLGMSLLFTILLAKPEGVRLANPARGQVTGLAVDVAGDAWFAPGPAALSAVRVIARGPGNAEVAVGAGRLVVKDRGRPTLPLSRWRGRIDLPVAGSWTLEAEARSVEGRVLRSDPKTIEVSPGAGGGAFRAFGTDHLVPMTCIAVAAIAAAILIRRAGGRFQPLFAWIVSIGMWGNELVYQTTWFLEGGWSAPSSLIIQMCGLSILLIPFALFIDEGRARRRLVELIWFWGIGGATQALLSPDLGAAGFPNFRYFAFFLSHGLIIVAASALVAEKETRIDLRSFGRVLILTNLLLVPMALVDAGLSLLPPYDPGNYFVLSYPPPEGSPIDLLAGIFGPAPRYLIGLELLAAAIFALLWLPFALTRLAVRGRGRSEAHPTGGR